MEAPIASLTLKAVPVEGEPFEVTVSVCSPYFDEQSGLWRCAARMDPLHSKWGHIAGTDSFQALCLALQFLRVLMTEFQAQGGQLLCTEDYGRFPLEAYIHGPPPSET